MHTDTLSYIHDITQAATPPFKKVDTLPESISCLIVFHTYNPGSSVYATIVI